jgi:alpha-ketoglutarate-dependent taurine dioxygenase
MEFYNSKTVSPIITQHPFRNYPVIRYNEPSTDKNGRFINPASLLFTGIPEKELVEFHHSLLESLYSQHHFYAHKWHIGDVVISDNFTLLHGREAFLSKSPRHLRRVHVLSNPPFDNPGLESYK